MPRPKKQAVITTLCVLQPMIDGIRSPYNKPKGGPDVADRMVALLDAVARALEADGMTLSASRKVLTARRERDKIDLRIVEQSTRASRPGEPYRLEPTGFLYVTTDGLVPWGKWPRMQRVTWQKEPGTYARDLAKRLVADLPAIFDARQRWEAAHNERECRWAREQAERDRARREAADLQARIEQQDALASRVVQQTAQARELRRFLTEAPMPRDGQEGYRRMLATVAGRLAALERDLDPDAIEAAIRAKELFPRLDGEG